MQRSIYGLPYDYVEQNGRFLVIGDTEGVQGATLAELQIKMIRSNEIPRQLPLIIEENNWKVMLYYPLANKRVLRHVLKGQKITAIELLTLLLQLATALDDSKSYMLRENQYILDEDFIYVGKDFYDVYLVYLPLQAVPQLVNKQEEWKSLVTNLLGAVVEWKGSLFQQLMEELQKDTFSIPSWKERLKQLLAMTEHGERAREEEVLRSQTSNGAEALIQRSAVPPIERKDVQILIPTISKKESIVSTESIVSRESTVSQQTARVKDVPQQPTGGEESPAPLSSRSKTYIILGALFLVALMWRGYLEIQHIGFLWMSIGFTMLIGVGVFVLFSVWRPQAQRNRNSKKERVTSDRNQFTEKSKQKKAIVHLSLEESQKPDSSREHAREGKAREGKVREGKVRAEKITQEEHYHQLPAKTTLLVPDATVLLDRTVIGQGVDNPQEIQKMAWLEVEVEGILHRIDIPYTPFTIGRNSDMVDYVDQTPGISRAHVEIEKREDCYVVRDLGSSNGTTLNGEILLPNKEYLLQDSDCLLLAQRAYTYKEAGSSASLS